MDYEYANIRLEWEKTDNDKHSSLLRYKKKNYDRKKVYSTGPRPKKYPEQAIFLIIFDVPTFVDSDAKTS